jgi:hypothetical protein
MKFDTIERVIEILGVIGWIGVGIIIGILLCAKAHA